MDKDNIKKEDKVKITRDRHGHTYFWCSCTGHMITLWWDDEFEFDLVEMSFWESPGNHYGWRQKLAHIWHIIRDGSPYADHISFDADECDLFIETLKEYSAKARGAKEKAEKNLAAYQLKHKNKDKEEKPFTPKPGVAERYEHIGEGDECDCEQCRPPKNPC